MARTISDGNIRIMVAGLAGVFAILAGRLVYVQCFNDDPVLGTIDALQSPNYHSRQITLRQQRGHIYDRNHFPLTDSHRYYNVFIDSVALNAEHQWAVSTNLSTWFPQIDPRALFARIDADRARSNRYDVVASTEDPQLAELIRRLGRPGADFRGLAVEENFRREYTLGEAASHVVGFVNREGLGVAGIEMRYNEMLSGVPGHMRVTVDAFGREIRHLREDYTAPTNGIDIELTIDHRLQKLVDNIIDETWRSTQSLAAWALVYDCRSGEVLAMVDRPTVDPEHYGADFEAWQNRCVAFRYEPGSVMKPTTITGALSEGVITTNTVFDTGRGAWHFGGYPLRDHFDGPGCARDFIRKSSNKGTAMIALELGRERLASTLRKAGYGARTGIELPAENPGNLGRPDRWSPLNLTRIGIGQSVDVTAIQLACAYGAIGNGGIRMKPHIVRRILSPDGTVLRDYRAEPVPEPAFAPAASAAMLEMLESVVTVDPVTRAHGTGRRAAVPGYRVGGKTGTAQMLVNHHYSSTDYHATFCGLIPIDAPQYVVVVTLQRPVGLHGGGDVAAPAFSKIALQLARLYGIPSTVRNEGSYDLGEPEPDPEGLLDPFPNRDPEQEPNFILTEPMP